MKKKVLITGAGGFVASNFIRKAIYDKEPYEFVSIDNVKTGSVLNNLYSNKGNEFYVANITDQHVINIAFEIEQPDIVLHAAVEKSINDNSFIDTNIKGTQVIIDACLKWKVNKLIYLSDDSVYGHHNHETNITINESGLLRPDNKFSISKATAEQLIQYSGLNYNIIRSCNSYGARQSCNELIPNIIKHIYNNEKFKMFGKGDLTRDRIYIADLCSAILQVLKNGGDSEVYNVAAGQIFSSLELHYEIAKIMERGQDLLEFVPGSENKYKHYLDTTKLKNLGWILSYKLKAALPLTVQWYLNNNWFLKL